MLYKHTKVLLRILPRDGDKALSADEVCRRWDRKDPISVKTARRLLQEASSGTSDANRLAINIPPQKVGGREPTRYYRNPAYASGPSETDYEVEVRSALTAIADHLVVGTLNRSERIDDLSRLVSTHPEVQKRLADGIRFAPDWIGRQPAKIDASVLKACIEGLGNEQALCITIHDRHDKKTTQEHVVYAHGLVVKDATTYLLAADRQSQLGTYALHRILSAKTTTGEFVAVNNFNLEEYIQQTHGFCFPINGDWTPRKLVLEVAPETIYHFLERPLPNQEEVGKPDAQTGWYTVRADVPMTILLVPFLLSMGHWIRVLGPEMVVNEIAYRTHRMAAHYPVERAEGPSLFAAGPEDSFGLGHEA
jgi:predicted DNA-binding transcriptional regulator YafY